MADNLVDGEFWLPSHFLTDEDILMDFNFSATTHGGSSSSISDLEFTSTFTESDEDDIQLAGLTHQLTRSSLHDSSCPVHSKGCGVFRPSSPQSTLCGCMCNQSSSRESVSPPLQTLAEVVEYENEKNNDGREKESATLDLLNKAAGEVARLKLTTEKKVLGTGFFDCSKKGGISSYPPPNPKNLDHFAVPPVFHPQFLHFPPMFWMPTNEMKQQLQEQRPKQKRATKSTDNNNRPLGLPPSAWPPLQAQQPAQAQSQAQPQTQPPKGTGVFLPRHVATPVIENETRKKSDGKITKPKKGKGILSQTTNRRNSDKTSTTNHNGIQLPKEWTY